MTGTENRSGDSGEAGSRSGSFYSSAWLTDDQSCRRAAINVTMSATFMRSLGMPTLSLFEKYK